MPDTVLKGSWILSTPSVVGMTGLILTVRKLCFNRIQCFAQAPATMSQTWPRSHPQQSLYSTHSCLYGAAPAHLLLWEMNGLRDPGSLHSPVWKTQPLVSQNMTLQRRNFRFLFLISRPSPPPPVVDFQYSTLDSPPISSFYLPISTALNCTLLFLIYINNIEIRLYENFRAFNCSPLLKYR